MSYREKVYDAFAELIYAVVIADGKISLKEQEVISDVMRGHVIKIDIEQYFNSKKKDISIAQSFLNTLEICKQHGNDTEYSFLIKIVEDVSRVSEGLNKDENNLLDEFILSFKNRFSIS